MFESILIANRGEIACRVTRTCRRLGIRAVAVYSDADAGARHVAEADEAWPIGPAPSRDSYLNIGAVIAAARAAGAAAIHPGYGFLSENPLFAEACADAGIAFIGPPPAAIRAMGSKSTAKALMETAGVPLLPGYHGDAQDAKTLKAAAKRAGYPVLIKPAAGGGGRGMRRVDKADELEAAIESARREALSSFGDDHLLIEKYLPHPRHIEVQIFADAHGNCIHLFERDCSVQRRHQKVIEEAPGHGLDADVRARLGAAAVAAARAVDYVGAGTVEFLLEPDGDFYFMEMNTRLQVEHPVTEMVTGLDLVAWQIAVAAGESLSLDQDQVTLNGHAIEARLYAEDPSRDFRPGSGPIARLVLPPEDEGLRIDAGVVEGGIVTHHYDAMIAKIIVHGPDRDAAIRRLRHALAAIRLAGPAANTEFLAAICNHPDYVAGKADIGFVDRELASLAPPPAPAGDEILAAAVGALLTAEQVGVPASPWGATDGWRLNGGSLREFRFRDGDDIVRVGVRGGALFELPGGNREIAEIVTAGARVSLRLGDSFVTAETAIHAGGVTVFWRGLTRTLVPHDPLAEAEAHAGEAVPALTAPMPGVVVAVSAAAGQAVTKGAPLIVVEAMKVEHTIRAPSDGVVDRVLFSIGDPVEEGADLVAFTPAA